MLIMLFLMRLIRHIEKQKRIKIFIQGNNSFIGKIGGKMFGYWREETIDISASDYNELIEKVESEINEKVKQGWELISMHRYMSKSNLFPYHYSYTVRKHEQ